MDKRNKIWSKKLYRYQRSGVRFLERNNGRGIIGDDMGLGKTLQAITWIVRNKESRPVVVVCPSSVKIHWSRELINEGLKSDVLKGQEPYKPETDIWILNYHILQYWTKYLIEMNPKTLIADECHFTKNRKTKRTKACRMISRHCDNVIGLSGTPIRNRPDEYFPILNMVAPKAYKEFESFLYYAMRYCDAKMSDYGAEMDTSGNSNLDELHERASHWMIRRMKQNVMEELPEKTYSFFPIEIDNRKDYEKIQKETVERAIAYKKDRGNNQSRMSMLTKIQELKAKAAQGKVYAVIEWINDWLEENDGKLVVFAVHHDVVDTLHKNFPKQSVTIDGRVSVGEERQSVVDDFVENKRKRICIATIKTAGTGLDKLQKVSDTMAFVELEWSPTDHDQAESRILRIGQKSKKCFYYYFVAENTIEQKVLKLLNKKRGIIDHVVDGIVKDGVLDEVLSSFVR